MSAILKKHLQAASARSKNYTDTEILTFVSTINNTLSSQNLRITELENNSSLFYVDNDGDICQTQEQEEENTNE